MQHSNKIQRVKTENSEYFFAYSSFQKGVIKGLNAINFEVFLVLCQNRIMMILFECIWLCMYFTRK